AHRHRPERWLRGLDVVPDKLADQAPLVLNPSVLMEHVPHAGRRVVPHVRVMAFSKVPGEAVLAEVIPVVIDRYGPILFFCRVVSGLCHLYEVEPTGSTETARGPLPLSGSVP